MNSSVPTPPRNRPGAPPATIGPIGETALAGAGPVPMTRFHLPDVVGLERELFTTDSPWTRSMFADELDWGHHYRVLLGPGGRVAGYAGLAIVDDETAEVRTIGVAPAHRGHGLGRLLLDDLLAAAGGRRVLLEVRTDNDIARNLYTTRGFAVIGLRRGYYQPSGADAHVMERPARATLPADDTDPATSATAGGSRAGSCRPPDTSPLPEATT